MKLYMGGSNIDVQSCREKIAVFWGAYEEGFLYMKLARHVENASHVEKMPDLWHGEPSFEVCCLR